MLLGFAGCAKSDAAAPPAPKAVAAAPIIPTATPIKAAPVAAAAPDVDPEEEFEMPAERIERRTDSDTATGAATATATATKTRPYREPILSDSLGLLDEAPTPTLAPKVAPSPEPVVEEEKVDVSDLELMEAATRAPAPSEMAARTAPVVKSEPSTAPKAPVKASVEPAPAPAPTSTVSVGPTTSISTSSLSPTDVRKTIQHKYLDDVRTCHGKAPDQSGSVTVQINVGPDGRVAVARAFGFATAVDGCLKAAARGWRFDIPRDGAGQPTTAPYKIEFRLSR